MIEKKQCNYDECDTEFYGTKRAKFCCDAHRVQQWRKDKMNAKDLIYNEIYKGSLRAGATERAALDSATTGLEAYKRGTFKTAKKLIDDKIKEATKRKYA